ncbi:MAG: tRNA pseudouridine(38-40) synthase TruA [Actinomycetia bacterium]|nr:tRNA pseudouridine(38-40) synthase TruA [Actinomycetes bacterium]
MRLRLDLGYDGSGFSGWAKQPERRTVEGVLDDALGVVLRLDPAPGLTVAGRTDAGVHARGQVAHTDVPADAWNANDARALFRLSGVLPVDVRVWRMVEAPQGFDARFSATSRRYTFRIIDNPVGTDPIRRSDVVWNRRPLDVDAMNAAAAELRGEHDFVAFCKKREGASTVRTLKAFEWGRREDGLLEATVQADAFCHNMVRSLVGACVVVGEGRRPASWVGEVLSQPERSSAVMVMPPHGLTLEEVNYPPDADLAAQALASRRFRG